MKHNVINYFFVNKHGITLAYLSTVLHIYYFAPESKERKFFFFEHYRMAIELEAEGSNNWYWCSLCKNEHAFLNSNELNDHFHKEHVICAKKYTCGKLNCMFTTHYPSHYRQHVKSCTPQYKDLLGATIDVDVIDCFADYGALKCSKKGLLHPIIPGVPTCHGFTSKEKKTIKSQVGKSGHEMDIIAKKPISVR